MTTMRNFGAILAAIILATPAIGDEKAAAGKQLAVTCATCHGGNGIAMIDMYPHLAGQNEKYLVSALKAYRAGQRQGGTAGLMAPVAKTLSDEDIEALARYYASLPRDG